MAPKLDLYSDLKQLSLGIEGMEMIEDEESMLSPQEMAQISEAARIAFEAKPELTKFAGSEKSWFEDYIRLREFFPWRVATWIAWAASPKVGRWPKTQMELASTVLGLSSDRVIGKWRSKYAGIDTVVATMQAAPLMDHRRDAFEALAASAGSKDHRSNPDRKLFFEMTGDHTPHMTIDDKRRAANRDLAGLSDAELDELEGELDALPPFDASLRQAQGTGEVNEDEESPLPPFKKGDNAGNALTISPIEEESPLPPFTEGGQNEGEDE